MLHLLKMKDCEVDLHQHILNNLDIVKKHDSVVLHWTEFFCLPIEFIFFISTGRNESDEYEE